MSCEPFTVVEFGECHCLAGPYEPDPNVVLTIITISKGDQRGGVATLASTQDLRALRGVEHIVVDGDGSLREEAESRGCCWVRQAGTGISGAFNEGIALARGEWVWFLNGGDRMAPELPPRFLVSLLQLSVADVLIGATRYEGAEKLTDHPPLLGRWPPVRPWIPHPSTLVRRQLFAQFGSFDERYRIAMDYEWWLRVLSSHVSADVLSVPFSVFAGGGVSQRLESKPLIADERDAAIRRHQICLWRTILVSVVRFGRMWLVACVAMLLPRSKRR